MIQGTKEFELIDYFFNMTLDSGLRKEWQTLKAAVLAQQPTNSQSTPLCACGQPAVKVLCDNCFCDEVFASTKKRAYSAHLANVVRNKNLESDIIVGEKGKEMKYRKKPVVIEAVQFNQFTLSELYDFLGITNKGSFLDCGHGIDPTDGQFKITTLEGVHVANINDYIIRGIKGEFYPCKPDIFEMTYEKAEDAPKNNVE